jgi:hypothetical protein
MVKAIEGERNTLKKSFVLFVLLCGLKTFAVTLEKPEIPPTAPYDPSDPEQDPAPIPLPPDTDSQPKAPVREPDQPPPITDPSVPEPTRLRQ